LIAPFIKNYTTQNDNIQKMILEKNAAAKVKLNQLADVPGARKPVRE
jgi:hypothetical protein